MYQDIELQHYFASYQNKTNLGEYLQNFQLFVHEKLCSASILYQPTVYDIDRKPTLSFSRSVIEKRLVPFEYLSNTKSSLIYFILSASATKKSLCFMIITHVEKNDPSLQRFLLSHKVLHQLMYVYYRLSVPHNVL